MKHTVIFFDDYPLHSENVLFIQKLKRKSAIPELHIETEKTVRGVEERLKTSSSSVAILDLMAEVPRDFRSVSDDNALVPSALAGLEIVRRCRTGYYGKINQITPIFIRSARGEPHIRKLCMQVGASGYFQAGTDDSGLIKAINNILSS